MNKDSDYINKIRKCYPKSNPNRVEKENITYRKNLDPDPDITMLENGVINICNEIEEFIVKDITNDLLYMKYNKIEPITIYINSPGGNVFSGLGLYDFIREMVDDGIDICTIAQGHAASMGAILLQAGKTRIARKNCWILVHELSQVNFGKLSDLKDAVKMADRLMKESLLKILAERSTLSLSQITKKCDRKDWWISSSEALKLGFIDKIV